MLSRSSLQFILPLLFFLSSCAHHDSNQGGNTHLVYRLPEREKPLQRFAPLFVVEEADKEYNRIGKVEAAVIQGEERVYVNPDSSIIYGEVRSFSTERQDYTNLIYRIHFSQVPLKLFPFYLGAGKNVGLLAVVTLNSANKPVLYTFVHTCGCYLAFLPTSYLHRSMWPDGWNSDNQYVYGETLPGYLEFSEDRPEAVKVLLRSATHRVKNVWLAPWDQMDDTTTVTAELKSSKVLENISVEPAGTTSFYETEGSRFGYVKESQKIWERLLISWWAFDWRVGEDKKLGIDVTDGTVFYTSLKPWARQESDMRDFPRFLRYWGWGL